MSALASKVRFTAQEYLQLEAVADFKSEYHAGEMFAMAGGTPRHGLILGNAFAALHFRLRGRSCTVYPSDLRIAVPPAELFTYPDLSVFCEAMQFADAREENATNPTLLVEVISPSTEAYVRGKKFEFYRQIPALREYLLIAQDEPLVERFFLEGEGRWVLTTCRGLEAVTPLESLQVQLPLAEIYQKVSFPPG